MAVTNIPYIPETITVHLGTPDQAAQNVTVSFPDYIKNVASSEIYPTWPESAIRANILAQISFALNRIYTEWYRSKGYDFDITNSTQYDQAFVNGREVFENISQIVDDIFNNYVRKQGSVEPYFTQFCNGTTVTCDGLSQWGTVDLANQGKTPFEILQYYYGDDIELVTNAPIRTNIPSYPGILLRLGVGGNDVRTIQMQLNRIAQNYPSIPKIPQADGVYGKSTEDAVKAFQRIFNLTPDGIVGKATWYKIKYIYNSVKQLGELSSEGVSYEEISTLYDTVLREGSRGGQVKTLQYYLNVIAFFNDNIPFVANDGIFGPATADAVRQFQKEYGLTEDGIVGRQTWNKMNDVYQGLVRAIRPEQLGGRAKLYPGYILTEGARGQDVTDLQTYLSMIRMTYRAIPEIPVTGYFGPQTANAVRVFQRQVGLPESGSVNAVTWKAIEDAYNQITLGGL